jgi:hypothetical protein
MGKHNQVHNSTEMTYTTEHYLQAVQTEIMYRAQQILTKGNNEPCLHIAEWIMKLGYIEYFLLNSEFSRINELQTRHIMTAIHIAYIRDQDDNGGRNGALWEAMREHFYYHLGLSLLDKKEL